MQLAKRIKENPKGLTVQEILELNKPRWIPPLKYRIARWLEKFQRDCFIKFYEWCVLNGELTYRVKKVSPEESWVYGADSRGNPLKTYHPYRFHLKFPFRQVSTLLA